MPKDVTEIVSLVNDKETQEFNGLFTRHDEDYDVWDMTSNPSRTTYESQVRARTQAHDSDIEIIANDLRVYSDNVQSTLASSSMQVVVSMAEAKGEDKRDEIGELERLFTFALEKIDERLRRLLLPPLRETLIWYSLVRGWVAGRFLVYKNKNNVVFDGLGLDPRWLTYEVGENGLAWSNYKTFRSQSSVLSEYGYKSSVKRNVPVLDWWENDNGTIYNSVICEREFVKEPAKFDIPSMPVLIMPVSTRPPVASTNGIDLKGYGESIFASARKINAVRNRFASIVANHANLMANQALINYKDEQGSDVTTTANVPGGVINLAKGHNELLASPMKEISPTVVNMLGWLNAELEQAVLPKIPIGSPAPSGTLYNLAQEAGNKIFNPQLRNLSYFYSDICRLIEEQLVASGIRVKISGKQRDKYYEVEVKPVDLKRPHIIKVNFTARTPWSQMDTLQVADMAKRLGLPDVWVWETILQIQDPKMIADLVSIEIAEHSPKLAMIKAILAMGAFGRYEEAAQMMKDYYNIEMQETSQGQSLSPEPSPAPEAPMPMQPPVM